MIVNRKVLVTGGAGYIGSHTVIALYESGARPYLLDDFSNSDPIVCEVIAEILGEPLPVIQLDLAAPDASKVLSDLFATHHFDAVVHFAASKSPTESCKTPLKYYCNNVLGSLNLIQAMENARCKKLVFSSSAAIYDHQISPPIDETRKIAPISPYGYTKAMIEQVLIDICSADKSWSATALRYFNPVGAHPSGLLGDNPQGTPNNLVPYLMKVALGEYQQLTVYGNDWLTSDGTGVRDYIHVMDLAEGHVCALEQLLTESPGWRTFNLGTGRGYSVLDVIHSFEKVTGITIPFQIAPRRSGDVAQSWADPTLANKKLNWCASRELDEMLADQWRFTKNLAKNPA